MRVVLFLVLAQHLILQLMGGSNIVAVSLLAVTEFFFQHFAISFIGESGSILLCTAVFKLLISHWLVLPAFVLGVVKDVFLRDNIKNDDKKEFKDEEWRKNVVRNTVAETAV